MPTVRRLQREVSPTALPGVQQTAGETPTSTGAGLAIAKGEAQVASGRALSGLGAGLAETGGRLFARSEAFNRQLADEARKNADQVALLNAENQLGTWENQRLYDPQSGALTVHGKDSFGLPEQLATEFGNVAGDVEQGLGTPEQRTLFQRIRTQRGLLLDQTIRRHVFGEMQRYEGEELQGLVENAQSAAIANALDPKRVGIELTRGVTAIQTHAPRLGQGPEQVQHQVELFTSATHVGVIDRLLATDRTKAAKVYFEETRDQIKGEAIARVEKAIEEGTLRGDSQKQADTIIASGGTLTQQREQARAIEDPKLRDEVMQRIEHDAAIGEKVTRDREEAALTAAYNLVDKSHDVHAIPPTQWSALPGQARSALRSYAEHLAKGIPVQTDLPTYYSLMQQAGTDPQTFTRQNLLNYRAKLDEPEFKQLAGLQLSIRNGDREKADKELSGFRTHSQIVDDSLSLYGVDPNAKPTTPEGKAIAQLRRMLDTRVEAQGALTGKKQTNDDIQRTLDGLLSQSVTVPGSWWNIFPGGKSFTDTQKPLVTLQADDIPAEERTLIEDALRRRHRPISDATVLDLYLETRARTGK